MKQVLALPPCPMLDGISLKPCTRCNRLKSRSAFTPNRRYRSGLGSHCKDCLRTARSSRKRQNQEYARRYWYNITQEGWDNMVAAQGNRCAICQGVGELVVDHDHACCSGRRTCGQCVRGLLCLRCNAGVGFLGDDPNRLKRAAEYITAVT